MSHENDPVVVVVIRRRWSVYNVGERVGIKRSLALALAEGGIAQIIPPPDPPVVDKSDDKPMQATIVTDARKVRA